MDVKNKNSPIDLTMYKIKYDHNFLVEKFYVGRTAHLKFEDNSTIPLQDIKESELYIKCKKCTKKWYLKSGLNYYLRKNSATDMCLSCSRTGKLSPMYGKEHTESTKRTIGLKNAVNSKGEKNPFYGKTHSKESRIKISNAHKGKLAGKNNPFFGKHHSKETKKIIRDKNIIYHSKLTNEQKVRKSQQLSDAHHRLMKNDPESYIENKRKAALVSAKSQSRYKINKIETIVMNELKERGLEFDYSVIMNYMQFDFGNKKHRILLEVHGDYWHGNPKKFSERVEKGKRLLNETQLAKQEKDRSKKKFAENNNFKLFIIWEDDIMSGNFSIIDIIEKLIKKEEHK